jgi:hypothetical protein
VGVILNSGATINIKNNILGITTTNADGIYIMRPATISGTFTCNYNMYWNSTRTNGFYGSGSTQTYATWQGYGYDTNSFNNTDPLFTNGSTTYSLASDFHLQGTSPCINAGVSVGLTLDKDGCIIIGNPDIGAYEYGSYAASVSNSKSAHYSVLT